MHPRVEELIEKLHLMPHPEGGYYREVFRSEHSVTPADERPQRSALTTIYFLLPEGAVSRWHRVKSDEVWHFYEGSPLELLVLDPSCANLVRHRLGPFIDDTQMPVATVKADNWQAARPSGAYTLVGCTVGPGFDFADFAMLSEDWELAEKVSALLPDDDFLL